MNTFTTFCRLTFAITALVLGSLLAGCASPHTEVILLPQANGKASAVVVHSAGGDVLLSLPYQRVVAHTGARTAPVVEQLDAAAVQKAQPLLFELAPPAPRRFTLFFVTGGTVLTPESMRMADQALADAMARTGGDMVITGHTDTKGSSAMNDALSAQRAQQIRQLFVGKGFPETRIESAGRGERELAVPTADDVDEPRNRRVTIDVR